MNVEFVFAISSYRHIVKYNIIREIPIVRQLAHDWLAERGTSSKVLEYMGRNPTFTKPNVWQCISAA